MASRLKKDLKALDFVSLLKGRQSRFEAAGTNLAPISDQASPIFHSSCEGKLGIALE